MFYSDALIFPLLTCPQSSSLKGFDFLYKFDFGCKCTSPIYLSRGRFFLCCIPEPHKCEVLVGEQHEILEDSELELQRL